MRKFIKGTLATIVEDDDKRVADYLANGWSEQDFAPTEPTTDADKMFAKTINDANVNGTDKTKKHSAPNKKINEAIKANNVATLEDNIVDDGLMSSKEQK